MTYARSATVKMLHAAAIALVALATDPLAASAQVPRCEFRGAPSALAERPSPLDSVTLTLGGDVAKLCYGRPSAQGRTVVGGVDPFGMPWRLGANEPTTLHLPFPATIGEVEVDRGSYSLYAIPDQSRWTVVVNGNTNRWGIPLSADVRAADLGSFAVTAERVDEHVETLTFSFEPRGADAGDLVYRWESTTFRIPIRRR